MIKITKNKREFFSFIIILILVFSITIFTSCSEFGKNSQEIETFTVSIGDLIQTVSSTGYVTSSIKNTYTLQTSGEVLRALDKGDRFKKGDMLIELDNSRTDILISQAEENLELSKSSLDLAMISYKQALDANHIAVQLSENNSSLAEQSVQSALKAIENADRLAKDSADAAKTAWKGAQEILEEALTNPLVTDVQIDQFEANVDSSRENYEVTKSTNKSQTDSLRGAYEQALISQSTTYWTNLSSQQGAEAQIAITLENIKQVETQIRLAEISMELVKLDDGNNIITAPYDGIVTVSNFKAGEFVSPGVPALEIISNDFLITSDINETDIANLQVGQEVSIILDAYYNQEFTGEIIEISPTSTNIAGVVTFEITVKPDTENAPQLLQGLSASLSITTLSLEDILYVPIQAIFEEDGRQFLEIPAEDNQSEKVEVETGIFNYDFIEIKSGLKDGDIIIVPEE